MAVFQEPGAVRRASPGASDEPVHRLSRKPRGLSYEEGAAALRPGGPVEAQRAPESLVLPGIGDRVPTDEEIKRMSAQWWERLMEYYDRWGHWPWERGQQRREYVYEKDREQDVRDRAEYQKARALIARERRERERRGRAPQYYYHGTAVANLHSIQQIGLKAGVRPGLTARASASRKPTKIDSTHVFLYPDDSSSRHVADRLKQETALLRVNINALDPDRVNITDSELQFGGVIGPELIEVNMGDGTWMPLTDLTFVNRPVRGVPVPRWLLQDDVARTLPDADDSDESDDDFDDDWV